MILALLLSTRGKSTTVLILVLVEVGL